MKEPYIIIAHLFCNKSSVEAHDASTGDMMRMSSFVACYNCSEHSHIAPKYLKPKGIGLTAYLAGPHRYRAQRPTNEFCWQLLRNTIVTSDDHVTIHEQRRWQYNSCTVDLVVVLSYYCSLRHATHVQAKKPVKQILAPPELQIMLEHM